MDTIPDLVINDTIYSIVNVKDFNQDGFDDFIIFYGGSSEYYGLHYGGPVFDTDPDMIFPVQNLILLNLAIARQSVVVMIWIMIICLTW